MVDFVEKRKYPRIKLMTLVDVQTNDRVFYDYTVSLSEGGMYLETSQKLSIDEKISLKFVLPKIDYVFESTAIVKWTNPEMHMDRKDSILRYPGAGIGFSKMPEEDAGILKKFLAVSI